MNIIHNSTKLITQLRTLEKELGDADYQVSLQGFSFKIKSLDRNFTIQDLKTIINITPPPEGALHHCPFDRAKKQINEYLSYNLAHNIQKEPSLEDFLPVSNAIALERQKKFWTIINLEFPLPPIYCLEHEPEVGSYFNNYLYWQFTFCLFQENQGIIIHGCAFD